MGIIPTSKWGDCSSCGDKNVAVVKVGKNLFCRDKCHRNNKVQQQVQKASERNKVRSLNTYQKVEGIVDSLQELTADLDRVVSRYVRIRDMEKDGKITCYTCDKRVSYLKAHCSHFINRSNMGTRFLLDNLRSCCYECNVEKRGNIKVFAERLTKENPTIVEWLNEQAHTVANPTRDELKSLLIDFQFKLRTVENAKLK